MTKGASVPSKSVATSTWGRSASERDGGSEVLRQRAHGWTDSAARSATARFARSSRGTCLLGLLLLPLLALRLAGRDRQRLEVTLGPALHVVVGHPAPQRLHPPPLVSGRAC